MLFHGSHDVASQASRKAAATSYAGDVTGKGVGLGVKGGVGMTVGLQAASSNITKLILGRIHLFIVYLESLCTCRPMPPTSNLNTISASFPP